MTDYCQIADVKSALDMTASTYDTQLGRIITAASRWVDEVCECGESGFAPTADATRYFEACAVEDRTLWIDMPLLSVTTLTNGDGATIDAGSYRLWPLNESIKRQIILKSAYAWTFTDEDALVSVAGRWGYSTSVPQPVNEATIIMAAWMHQRYMSGLADASASPELGQLIYGKPVPEQAKALLKPWIERRFLV
jgi:hypothetical protein